MKKLLFIILILLYFNNFSIAQKISKDSIFMYEINNDKFRAILDSFIYHEKQYSYFNNKVTLFLNILDSNGTSLQLSSGSIFEPLSIRVDDIPENCGVFYYKSIRFLMTGRSAVDERILKRAFEKIAVNKIKIKESDDVIEDDRYFPSTWIFKFSNGLFYSTWKSDLINEK